MLIYFVVAFISSFLIYKYSQSQKKVFLILSFIPFFLVMALRYGIGYDYLAIYTPIFKHIVSGVNVNWDIGMVILCKIIGIFSKDEFFFFFITSAITSIFFYKSIIENSDFPWMSLLIYVIGGMYIDSLNVVRQYVAISIFIYSLKYVRNKDFIKYLFLIIIASLFHNSAFMLIPAYWLLSSKPSLKRNIILLLIMISLMPVANMLFLKLISITKYSYYIDSSYGSANPTYSELIISSILLIISILFSKQNKNNINYNIYSNMTFLFFCTSLLSFKILLAYRLVMYFKISMIFLIPTIIKTTVKPKDKMLLFTVIVIMLSSITLIGAYKFNWYDTDYISIFDKN